MDYDKHQEEKIEDYMEYETEELEGMLEYPNDIEVGFEKHPQGIEDLQLEEVSFIKEAIRRKELKAEHIREQ